MPANHLAKRACGSRGHCRKATRGIAASLPTTAEGVQLSVANEALGAGRALVLSDTRVLRTMFGDAALLSQNTAPALVDTLRAARAHQTDMEAASRRLRDQRLAAWIRLVPQIRGVDPTT